MAFTPRTFVEILNDMVAYVQTHTSLSDFTPGSVIRSILEASAMEDDEQYFQMVQLLETFSINSATGTDLDNRMQDFRLFRALPVAAAGEVQFADTNAKTTQVSIDGTVGAVTITVLDSSAFPVSGFPYVIRVGEGGSATQDLEVAANNTAGGVFTISGTPLLDNIAVGATVTLVTGSVPRTLAAGTTVEAPATVYSPLKRYMTLERSVILPGNILSNIVRVRATVAGTVSNTGSGTITKFGASAPFNGATVTNVKAIEGGRDRETDGEFRIRGLNQLQSLSRGTPLALKSAAIGLTDTVTRQRVESANIIEDFVNKEVLVYIDDGTGLSPKYADTGVDVLAVATTGVETTLSLNSTELFPSAGTVLIDTDGTNPARLYTYTNIASGNVLVLASGVTADVHDADSVVYGIDDLTGSSGAEATQRRFKLQNYPVVYNQESIFRQNGTTWTRLVRGTDYVLNNGTGELLLVDTAGLLAGTKLVAGYTYYTNLIALVQKVLEGDPDDPNNFPGVKAAGVFVRVLEPTIVYVSVRATITAAPGYLEENLRAPVRRNIEDYINSRKIGENIIVSRMIDVAMNVVGVEDIRISTPTSNIILLEDQIPLAQDTSGTLVVVT